MPGPDQPFIAMEICHVVGRQEYCVIPGGIQMAVGSVNNPRLGKSDAALGMKVRNDELMAFAGIRFLRGVFSIQGLRQKEQAN